MLKVISRLLWFSITTPYDWLTKLVLLKLSQRIVFSMHAFSRAWRETHVFASSFDWFVVLFTSVAIGQRNNFSFWFDDTQLETVLIRHSTRKHRLLNQLSQG